MVHRNVISGVPYRFIVDAATAMFRISAIDNLDEVKKICREHYKSHPVVVLCNEGLGHWENTVPITLGDKMLIRMFGAQKSIALTMPLNSSITRKDSAGDSFRRFT
jgi:hypothetical protein